MDKNNKNVPQWYVVQTKPLKEDWVKQQLIEANFEVFFPKIKSFCPHFGGKKEAKTYLKAFFPSYIFTCANLQDPRIHRLVRFTRGVNRILGTQTQPYPMSDQVINLIKENINQHGIIEYKTFKPGLKVRIKRGFLKDLVGILERPVDTMGRIRVLLNLVNSNMKTLLHCSDVERVFS